MKQRFHVFWIAGSLSLFSIGTISHAQAQSIQIDGTTPTTPGRCTGSCTIEGGLQRGSNLFHSFSQFNVDSGATVRFRDPGVTNILSRVTGTNRSDILGKLGVLGGNANLFLINPHGIIFGPNASLDVRGSFVATTANAIQFGDQGFFSASTSEVPLLTVNPSAFFYQSANGSIENNSVAPAGVKPAVVENPLDLEDASGLRVPDGRSLLLVGGDVTLSGEVTLSEDVTLRRGGLNAFGGRVELGGLAEPGAVGLTVDGNSLRLNFPDSVPRADVLLTNGAGVDVTGAGGGSIAINARNLDISGYSQLLAGIGRGLGSVGTQAGDITLNATEAVTVTNSQVLNRVRSTATGNGGNVSITARELSLRDGSALSATTFGQGNAGNIFVQVSDAVSLESASFFSNVETDAIGNGGNVSITARELSLRDESELGANIFGQGNAGSIFVQVSDAVSLASDSKIDSTVGPGAVGDGGEVDIRAQSLSLTGGAQLAATVFRANEGLPGGRGNGGNILVNASDAVNLSGTSKMTGLSSGLFAATEGEAIGPAGNITVNTDAFRIANGAVVNAQTLNQSNGGNISINATTFEAVNGGQITTTTDSSGDAGDITVNSTDSLTLSGSDPTFADRRAQFGDRVQNEAPGSSGLFAGTRANSTGLGGNIEIVTGSLLVRDGAQVTVGSLGTGEAGNLEVGARSILLDNQGNLTATTESGKGGNITINANTLVGLDNSDITANANEGEGGFIQITAQGVFGLEIRDPTNNIDELSTNKTNDISASSLEDPSLNGVVEINTPDVEPEEQVVNLPDEVVDVGGLVAQSCPAGGSAVARGSSEFVVTGRGGLPPTPGEALKSDAVLVDLGTPIVSSRGQPPASKSLSPVTSGQEFGELTRAATPEEPLRRVEGRTENYDPTNVSTNSTHSASVPITEAQGWVVGPNGEVVLTAQAPTVTPHNSELTSASCHGS